MDKVIIIGGGFAGLAAAQVLSQMNYEVEIWEETNRLGGKAGADLIEGNIVEHGYHIFPMWYNNFWKLAESWGISDNFVDCEKIVNVFPKTRGIGNKILTNVASSKTFLTNVFSGLARPSEMWLYIYSMIDLASRSYDPEKSHQLLSVNGFLRTRPYFVPKLSKISHGFVFHAISVPNYLVSAYTISKLMNVWMKQSTPHFKLLNQNAEDGLFKPIAQRLESNGVRIMKNRRVSKVYSAGGSLTKILFKENGISKTLFTNEYQVILAVGQNRLMDLLDSTIYKSDVQFVNLRGLKSHPMSSLTLWLNIFLEDLPFGLVTLVESKLGLTLVDYTRVWGRSKNSVLNIISTEIANFGHLNEKEKIEKIKKELFSYIPICSEDIVAECFQNNQQAPLFLNTVDSWKCRVTCRTKITNLFMAGDHCKNNVDLVTIESAVESGLRAAEEILKSGSSSDRVRIIPVKGVPKWQLILMRIGLFPIAMMIKLHLFIFKTTDKSDTNIK